MTYKEKAELLIRRFSGRMDVYGKARYYKTESGETKKQYNPVCTNLWAAGCHLKLRDGISCAKCEIKKYEPVTADSITKHIRGEEEQIIYTLREDGTILFGALDLDMKANKEEQGYTFEDAKKIAKVMDGWGIKYGIARSTTAGFHIYFFFSAPIAANKFRAVMFECAEVCGFMAQMRAAVRPLFEVFPKQGSSQNIGNGIKLPHIEPQFEKGRNCWVTINNEVIPAELQWEYLKQIPDNDPALFDKIIAENQIYVFEDNSPSATNRYSSLVLGQPRGKKQWQPPLTGSYEKVLEGCAAMRRVRSKWQKKEKIGHAEGFVAWWLAMHTADGRDIFLKESSWGTTEAERRQLEHSQDMGYGPPTCSKMQELGVCVRGTRCFSKKAPIDHVEGQTIVRDDLPQDQWPEPSAIRYAYGSGEVFLNKLINEADQLVHETDATVRAMKLKELVDRAQVFDDGQQEELKKHLEKLGLTKRKEANKLFREAGAQKEQEFRETAGQRSDSVVVNNQIYRKLQPFGYAMVKKLPGNKEAVDPICAADIIIKEEKHVRDSGETIKSTYCGTAAYPGYEYSFEINIDDWCDNGSFVSYFSKLLGSGFNVLRQDADYIRQATLAFSARSVKKSVYHATQGWSKDVYLMPSLLIDKDGIRPNTEQQVDLSHKEHASRIDFKILDDREFKEVMFHIKNDMLSAWDAEYSYTALAHSLAAPLIGPLKFGAFPTMFLEGELNTGKSALLQLMQHFYGNFPSVLNLGEASKGSLIDYGHEFKDCLLILDDFKNLTMYQVQTVLQTIQSAYDGNVSAKLRRDGQQRKGRGIRCLLGVTGEMTPENEASMMSRTIAIDVKQRSLLDTADQYDRCMQMKHLYCGVTPRFIHWFLQQDLEALKQELRDHTRLIQKTIEGETAADRIAKNIALNLLVWKLWVKFMLFSEVTEHREAEAFVAKHEENLNSIKASMILRCGEEKHSSAFLRHLQGLIVSGQVSIRNLDGYERENKPEIGYVKVKDEVPNRLYLYPTVAVELVKGAARSSPIAGTVRSLGRQLATQGVICEEEDGRHQKMVRDGIATQRVWIMDMTKIGLGHTPLRVVNQTQDLPLDSSGLI